MAATSLAAPSSIPASELRSAPMERILVIEHDAALRKVLQRLFSSAGYEVDFAFDAVCGLERLRQGAPAAVVLDLPRPGSSGCDFCREMLRLRQKLESDPSHPLHFLTVYGQGYKFLP
jgi:DNA-binding response OmpR family regulator